MNRLEERYRRVLRVLPVDYRREWEEDMVAALLDSRLTGEPDLDEYTADHGSPGWSEVASVLVLALRLRLGGVDGAGRTDRQRLVGRAVRLVVLTGALVWAALATAELLTVLWATGRLPLLPRPTADWTPTPSMWSMLWIVIGCAWALPYLALVAGHRRAAQAVGLPVAVAALVPTLMELGTGTPVRVFPWVHLLVGLVGVAAMTLLPEGVAPVAPRRWLLALPVGVAVGVPLLLLVQRVSRLGPAYSLDPARLPCLVVVAAVVGYLAWRPAFDRPASDRLAADRLAPDRLAPDRAAWALALAVHAGVVVVQRLVTIPDLLAGPGSGIRLVTGFVEIAAVVAAGVPLVRRCAAHLRDLPADHATISGPTSGTTGGAVGGPTG